MVSSHDRRIAHCNHEPPAGQSNLSFQISNLKSSEAWPLMARACHRSFAERWSGLILFTRGARRRGRRSTRGGKRRKHKNNPSLLAECPARFALSSRQGHKHNKEKTMQPTSPLLTRLIGLAFPIVGLAQVLVPRGGSVDQAVPRSVKRGTEECVRHPARDILINIIRIIRNIH
jgi:hypothetical protein